MIAPAVASRAGEHVMSVPDAHLRDELMDELHRANERFHQSRLEWEHWLAAAEFRHDERVDAAREKLRDAEREVQAVEERIRWAMLEGRTRRGGE